MSTVLAIVDNDPVRRQVLESGLALAGVYRAQLEAVHVRLPYHVPPVIEDDIGAPLRLLVGNVTTEIVAAISDDDVVAAAIGARTNAGDRRPAGEVALEVATRVDKPLALVPPTTPPLHPGQRLKVLVPLDGTELSALTVRALLRRVADADVEIVVLHVFGGAAVPRFLDHPEHDLAAWAEEFRVRYCDEPGSRVEWRRGAPGEAIAAVAHEEHVDGVIMGWGQEVGGGHAAAVRLALEQGGVPVVLVPRASAERTLAELPAGPAGRRVSA